MKRLTLWLLPMLLASCSQGPQGDSYFPLTVGSNWTYLVTADIDGHVSESKQWDRIDRVIDTDKGTVVVRRSEASKGLGLEYWIKTEPGFIKRIAQRSDADDQAKLDPNPITVLKLPIAKNDTWLVPSQPFVIAAKTNLGGEDMKMPKVMLNTTVEANDEVVTVPAGTFKDCVRIEGSGSMELYVDSVSGFKSLPIVHREWFCKGVGLVKVERIEELSSMFFSGGKITMELLDYKIR